YSTVSFSLVFLLLSYLNVQFFLLFRMYLESLFKKQYFIDHLFPALLNVFVSIEISDETNNGDVVAFEQKFNYRRPMYVVFKYLCTLPDHQMKLKDLATFAEQNMDAVQ